MSFRSGSVVALDENADAAIHPGAAGDFTRIPGGG